MDSSGIRIELNDLAKEVILSRTKSEIARKLAEAYAKTPDYESLLKSIKINRGELRKDILCKLVDEIINNWARQYHG